MIIPPDRLEEEKQCAERIKIAAASEEMNIQNILGFINQKKVNNELNISSIMWLKKLKFKDLYSIKDLDTVLLWDSILRRFTLIITSYFCLGTELWFLKQMKL